MNRLEKLSAIYNNGKPLVKLKDFGIAKVYQLADNKKLFLSNPSGVTPKGKNGWTQISINTYSKSNRNDIFIVVYEDTHDCFEFGHELLEKVLLCVDWNYEKDIRTDFVRDKDHNGLKFRGKEGSVTIHSGKTNLKKFNIK
jgi:hypothetical protein